MPEPPPLRVGVPADYLPFAGARDGALVGLDVDVAQRFARDSGRRVELVRFRWPELLDDLRAGRFALAMGGITMRPERAVAGSFTRPVAETRALVLVRPGLGANAAALDRPPVRLAVNAGGHLERVARRFFPHATIRAVDNAALAGLLARGEVDGVVTDDVEADVLAPALPGVRRLGPLTRDRKAYLGRDPALVDELDAWLRAREVDGTLDALREHWLGPARRRRHDAFASDLAALTALVDLRLSLMPAVAAAKKAAGLPVDDPEQEARVLAATRSRATALGLEPEAAAAFVGAQIAAARTLQRVWLAMPAGKRPPPDPLDLANEARPALDRISAVALARAADLVRARDAFARLDPARVATALDPSLVTPAHRRAIAAALVRLRAAPTAMHDRRPEVCKVGASCARSGPPGDTWRSRSKKPSESNAFHRTCLLRSTG